MTAILTAIGLIALTIAVSALLIWRLNRSERAAIPDDGDEFEPRDALGFTHPTDW
jgi:hypothetical protein